MSPDPAGAGWNAYAYATNPNSATDPLGLRPCVPRVCTTSNIMGPDSGDAFDLEFSWALTTADTNVSDVRDASTIASVLSDGLEVDGGPLPSHVDDTGTLVGDYPGEAYCATNNGCMVWNPSRNKWDSQSEADVYPPMAQGVLQGNRQLWNNANGTMKAVTAIYAAGFALGGAAIVAPAAAETLAITHLTVPAIPPGMGVNLFAKLLGFGSAGGMSAASAYETLAENGITFDMVVQWARFYGQEALLNPGNPSAAVRAAQLSNLIANWS